MVKSSELTYGRKCRLEEYGSKVSKKKKERTFLRLLYDENFQNHLNCTMSRQ